MRMTSMDKTEIMYPSMGAEFFDRTSIRIGNTPVRKL